MKIKTEGTAAVFCIAFCFTMLGLLVMWTDRSLDFVATALKGSPVDVPTWFSIVALFTGPFDLAFNLICEFVRLVI